MTNDNLDTANPPEAGDEQTDDDKPDESNRRRWSFLTEMVVLFAVALTIALLIKTFVVQPFFIPSQSMENTLLVGDKVLVNKLVYHLRPIERGDVVVFNGSGSWDPPAPPETVSRNPVARVYDDTLRALFRSIRGLFGTPTEQAGYVQTDYIKRVIGVPGDHVMCCNARGQLEVNGVPLAEKSYIFPGAPPSERHFSVVVPPGRVWVMGDNRSESADSRFHDCAYSDPGVECRSDDRDGTIPENKVIGRAFMIVWPPSRVRFLPIPSTFDQAKLAAAGRQGATSAKSGVAAASRLAMAGSIPLRSPASYLPLGLGLGAAVPVTLAERRLRKLLSGRRSDKRAG